MQISIRQSVSHHFSFNMFRCCSCFSSSASHDDQKSAIRLTKFQFIKLLSSLTLPLAIAIFTIITTIQNSRLARENREQDLSQAQDEQRQNVFVNYINDISQYRDEHFENLTNDPAKLLYIRTKTLTALRKLDNERKQAILLFLKESSLLSEDEESLLNGANFNGMIIQQNDCAFRNVIFSGVDFQDASFIHCVFNNVTFRQVNFHRAISNNSIFYLTHFLACEMDHVNFQETIISESNFDRTSLSSADFRRAKLDFVKFNNVNLTKAIFSHQSIQMKNTEIRNSLLSNGTFSPIDDIHIYSNFCTSFESWYSRSIDGIRIDNCTLVTNNLNVTMSSRIAEPFLNRSVLIDAGQAEFVFQLKQKYRMTFVSIIIYYIGIEHGIFERQQVDCPSGPSLTCQHRAQILPYTRAVSIEIKFSSMDTITDRIMYAVKSLNSNIL